MASTTVASHTPIMSATTIASTSPRPSLSSDAARPRPSISTLVADRPSGRVSCESQRPSNGRASPSPRTTSRRTPVPALLDSFPVPPSHIPLSPVTPVSPSIPGSVFGPSPTSPTSPPPVPGPSSALLSDLLATRRSFQTSRPASPASISEKPPRRSADGQGPGQTAIQVRPRKGSLSSLRNTAYSAVTYDQGQGEIIHEEPSAEVEHRSQCPPRSAPAPASVDSPSPPSMPPLSARDESLKVALPLATPVTLAPAVARPSASRKSSTGMSIPLSDNVCGEDSIATIDMSDLNALKSGDEGDGDELRAFPPFPPVPPIPHSVGSGKGGPLYTHTPRKPNRSAVGHVGDVSKNGDGVNDEQNHPNAHNDVDRGDVRSRSRSASPELSQIISLTPRPRKRSIPSQPRSRTSSLGRERALSMRSRKKFRCHATSCAETKSHAHEDRVG
ncbi:hypothetical protein EDC04DRAFT_1262994 [Pisolithus marmoratus]|nr:hypothetical protein EDC04DRAFT_1262994 [Pisolithus marmoratus]